MKTSIKAAIVIILMIIFLATAFLFWQSFKSEKKLPDNSQDSQKTAEKSQKNLEQEKLAINENIIQVSFPQPGDTIGGTINITGIAKGGWYFEGEFPIDLIGLDGKRLSGAPAMAQGEWMKDDFVPFSATLKYSVSKKQKAKLVFKKNNPSCLPEKEALIEIPVILAPEKTTVKLFFSSRHLDPYISVCDKVFPVARLGNETMALARQAVEELLKGATEKEKALGYYSSIPPGVKIQNFDASTEIAKIDLSKELFNLDVDVACRRLLIKTQIAETIKQISGAESVIITVDGKEFSHEIPEYSR